MDNRVFNINGPISDRPGHAGLLASAIELAMAQCGCTGIKGWSFLPDKGIVLFSYGPSDSEKAKHGFTPFLAPASAEEAASMIQRWLQTPEAAKVPRESWDKDYNAAGWSDGDGGEGWRCYVEDWGHVSGLWGVVCAVRPAGMWYGK